MTAVPGLSGIPEDALEDVACGLCGGGRRGVNFTDGPFSVVTCSDCGFTYVTPRLRDGALLSQVYDEGSWSSSAAKDRGYTDYRADAPRFLGRPGDIEAAKQAELNDLPPILDYLEETVPGEGGYLVGDRLTLADIAVAGPFANFRHTKTRVDPERYPRTVAYVDRILARPSFAPWIERETAFLAKSAA